MREGRRREVKGMKMNTNQNKQFSAARQKGRAREHNNVFLQT